MSPAPHRPRRYRPKIKGCYECSQRRIHCDRTEPMCQKCSVKGLQRSGYGIRYRFNNGVAARGLWQGKTIQGVYQQGIHRASDGGRDDEHDQPRANTRDGDRKTASRRKGILPNNTTTAESSVGPGLLQGRFQDMPSTQAPGIGNAIDDFGASCNKAFLGRPSLLILPLDKHDGPCTSLCDCAAFGVSTDEPFPSTTSCVGLRPLPSNVPPRAETLLLHFSEHIACEMIAIDGKHNGYRHLVLPIAHTDELVMNAVMTVSAFHLFVRREHSSQNTRAPNWSELTGANTPRSQEQPQPDQLYSRTIAILKQKNDLGMYDSSARCSVLLALLVLMIGVMVTGSDDFPILYRVLESALESVGREEGLGRGDLPDFIVHQIRKLRVYAAPFLSEQTGISVLSSRIPRTQVFDCLNYCCQQRREQSAAVTLITSLVQQSQEIYLQQAVRGSSSTSSVSRDLSDNDSIARVQCFKETLEAFPHEAPGEQVLIWATFVAASDCLLQEHKAFFRDTLRRHYNRNGFVNILKGVEVLEKAWTMRSCGGNWVSSLPEDRVFVM